MEVRPNAPVRSIDLLVYRIVKRQFTKPLSHCIIANDGETEEPPRCSPRSQGRQEGREGPLDRDTARGETEGRPQGCAGAVEETV